MFPLERIAAERERQRERWQAEHDDRHNRGELAMAAACYAVQHTRAQVLLGPPERLREAWPFELRYDRREQYDVIKRLTIAAALLVAEIERLERAAAAGDLIDDL